MRKIVCICAIALLSSAALAAVIHFCHGRGVIGIDDHHNGRFSISIRKSGERIDGSLEFRIFRGSVAVGSLVMRNMRTATFEPHRVAFSGHGVLTRGGRHHEVRVEGFAVDSDPVHPDRLGVRAFGRGGEQIYAAEGNVREGNIEIGTREAR